MLQNSVIAYGNSRVFQVNLGNIMPEQQVEIEMEYIQPLSSVSEFNRSLSLSAFTPNRYKLKKKLLNFIN